MEVGVVRKLPGRFDIRVTSVNGLAGAVGFLGGRAHAVTSFDTDGQRILSVMRILNPEKLKGVPIYPATTDESKIRTAINQACPLHYCIRSATALAELTLT